MYTKKYIVEHIFPPIIYVSHLDGKTYICPTWQEVPKGTTKDQLVHKKPDFLSENEPEFVEEFKSSSNPNITYVVKKVGNEYQCDCPGYKYQGKNCKHVKKFK